MKIKAIHWLKVYWTEIVRALTVLIIGAILFIGINGLGRTIALGKKANDIAMQNNSLALQIKGLSDQNIQLGKDNRTLSAQNRAFIKCIADIFARYTQNGQPVVIKDLQRCVTSTIQSQPAPSSMHTLTQQSASTNKQPSKNKPPSTPKGGSGNQQPGLVENQCSVNLFFVHLKCRAKAQ